jgi:hypothetical protein
MSTRLYNQWIEAKEAEKAAQEKRREIEDKLIAEMKIDETSEGATTIEGKGHIVKITTRFNRKINAESVQSIAIENGMESMVNTLFRWKPEISLTAWRNADKSITDLFAAAVTTTPGRPSFSIEKK